MDTNKTLYTNASVIIGGTVCSLMMANSILGRMSDWNEPSVFPGFRMMCGLCFPILCFWVGLLLRTWIKDPKWWLQTLLVGVAIFCLYRYGHFTENWGYSDVLYVSMAVTGFLIPPKTILSASQNKGWISLVLIALCAFCYTALTTVKNRLLWGPLIPEHPDMEWMMEQIMVSAEPLMAMITIYFVAQFSFSKVAQKLGSQPWFRGIVAVPCIYTFLGCFSRLFTMRMFGLAYSPFMRFIVHPITIYLIVFCSRLIREHRRKGKEKRRSWKELAKL